MNDLILVQQPTMHPAGGGFALLKIETWPARSSFLEVEAETKIRTELLRLLAQVAPANSFREVRAFAAPEAHQGVAVDAAHFYPITNKAVAKYDKRTGKLVQRWDSTYEDSTALRWVDFPLFFTVCINFASATR